MTLDYRTPDTHEHRVLRVMAELRNERVVDWVLAVIKILVGVPFTLLPSAVIAELFWFHYTSTRAFLWIFARVALIVTPLLIWIERRERQDYLWEAAYEGFEWTLLDILTIGPRLICSLYDQIRLPAPTEEITVLAAKIVVEMLDAGETIEIRSLMREDRTTTDITEALNYLETRRWVVISKTRARAWLGTSIRRQFEGL